MTACLNADTMVAIGDALQWEVPEGLRHLEACEECRAQLEVLRLTRAGLFDSEPVDGAVLARISGALSAAADSERRQVRLRERLVQAGEGVLAGITALVVLFSNRVPIHSIGAVAIGFGLGATLMIGGRVLGRHGLRTK